MNRTVLRQLLGLVRSPALISITLAWGLTVVVSIEPLLAQDPRDFLSYFYAARALVDGASPYDTQLMRSMAGADGVTGTVYPYLYSPFLAQVIAWCEPMSLKTALHAWLLLSVVALGSVGWFCQQLEARWRDGNGSERQTDPKPETPTVLVVLCLLTLPVKHNLSSGQVNAVVVALIVSALVSYLHGRSLLVGLLLAPAILIKSSPVVLLLFMLLRGAYATVLACLASMALIAIGSVWLGGSELWGEYIGRLSQVSYGSYIPGLFPSESIWNFSPSGHLSRLLAGHRDLVVGFSSATTFTVIGVACLLTHFARCRQQELLALALFFPAMIIASPLAYVHHVLYLAPAVAIWFTWARGQASRFWLSMFVLVLLVASTHWPLLYVQNQQLFAGSALRAINLFALVFAYALGVAAWHAAGVRAAGPAAQLG